MKKYSFTGETKKHFGIILHRIKADIAFSDIAEGEIGGWIEKEENLSSGARLHKNVWVACDDAWVYDNAKIYGGARVFGKAKIYDFALVYDNAKVYGGARVFGKAKIYDFAWVYDNAKVYGGAQVRDKAHVSGDAQIYANARVYSSAKIYGSAIVCGWALIHDNAQICGDKWSKSPLNIQGTKWSLNMASKSEIRIGCQVHTFEEWREKFREIAKEHDAQDLIREYAIYFNAAVMLYDGGELIDFESL